MNNNSGFFEAPVSEPTFSEYSLNVHEKMIIFAVDLESPPFFLFASLVDRPISAGDFNCF